MKQTPTADTHTAVCELLDASSYETVLRAIATELHNEAQAAPPKKHDAYKRVATLVGLAADMVE